MRTHTHTNTLPHTLQRADATRPDGKAQMIRKLAMPFAGRALSQLGSRCPWCEMRCHHCTSCTASSNVAFALCTVYVPIIVLTPYAAVTHGFAASAFLQGRTTFAGLRTAPLVRARCGGKDPLPGLGGGFIIHVHGFGGAPPRLTVMRKQRHGDRVQQADNAVATTLADDS